MEIFFRNSSSSFAGPTRSGFPICVLLSLVHTGGDGSVGIRNGLLQIVLIECVCILLRRRWLLLLRQPNLWEILSESRNWTGDGQCAQDPTITLLWYYFELSLQVPLRQPQYAWRSSLLCNNCRQHWSDDQQHERSQRCVQRQGMVLKRILLEIHCKWCFLKCWEITKRSIAAGRLHQSISCVPKNSKGAWNEVGDMHFSKKKKNWSNHIYQIR